MVLTFEKLELIIEDKDLLAWRDVLIEHGGKDGNYQCTIMERQ